MNEARTLVAVLVQGGRPNLAPCVHSAARLSEPGVDVLVLDDGDATRGGSSRADEGSNTELSNLCGSLGAGYYRSPRALGTARSMNLALRRALSGGYGHVLLAGPDVVLPRNGVAGLADAARADPTVASVTAWSNDVSVYSLSSLFVDPASGHRDIGHVRQDRVDWVSSVLQEEFGASSVEAPFAVGACCLVSVRAVAEVGLFDPAFGAFGRGGCDEVDWGLRARARRWRTVLAPGVFAYHAAGPSPGAIVPEASLTDKALDLRHPGHRSEMEGLLEAAVLEGLRVRAEAAIVREAARARGWCLEASKLVRPPANDNVVRFVVASDGDRSIARGRFLGATIDVALRPSGVIDGLHDLIGLPPSKVTIFDPGRHGDLLEQEAAGRGIVVVDARSYPETL